MRRSLSSAREFSTVHLPVVSPAREAILGGMKTLTVQLPKEQFSHLLMEAHRGDVIVLTDGERRMELEATPPHGGALGLNLEEGSPELEAELLKAVRGPHAPLAEPELRALADQALQEHRTRRG
jgi:hypothetical protein